MPAACSLAPTPATCDGGIDASHVAESRSQLQTKAVSGSMHVQADVRAKITAFACPF